MTHCIMKTSQYLQIDMLIINVIVCCILMVHKILITVDGNISEAFSFTAHLMCFFHL